MEGYIDIHSHLLPQLDDGSTSMEQTKNMLKIAFTEGIRTIIATPHYHEGRSMNSILIVEESLKKVKEEIGILMPQMNFLLGSEIYYSHESVKLLNSKQIPTMADSKYVLVEFSPIAEYRYIKNGLQEFLLEGYCPILAHVERYSNVTKELERVEEFIDMGAYIQVNAMSITGETSKSYQGIAKKLLKKGYIHFIATDSHSDGARAPRLKKCVEIITKKYGEAYAKELLIENQTKILSNEYL